MPSRTTSIGRGEIPSSTKPGRLGDATGVDLHQFHLIAGDWRARPHLGNQAKACQTTNGTGSKNGFTLAARAIVLRSSSFEYIRGPPHSRVSGPISVRCITLATASATSSTSTGCNCVSPPPEHRINGKATQQLDDGVEKRIIGAEHHGRSDHAGASKRREDRHLSLASCADVV
jgi:hypothetical protein